MSDLSVEELARKESSAEEVSKSKQFYESQVSRGTPSTKATVEYALALVRSSENKQVELGLNLLGELWRRSADEEVKRLCILFAIIGYYRLDRFEEAHKYANELFKVRPRDRDCRRLVELIQAAEKRKTMQVAMVAGGSAVAAGLIAAAAFGISRLLRR